LLNQVVEQLVFGGDDGQVRLRSQLTKGLPANAPTHCIACWQMLRPRQLAAVSFGGLIRRRLAMREHQLDTLSLQVSTKPLKKRDSVVGEAPLDDEHPSGHG
jgi:hypothetical protein